MKKCTYCGKEYPDETAVCDIDGQPLQSPGTEPPGSLPPEISPAPAGEPKQSVLGVISFAMSVGVALLMLATFVVAGVMNAGRIQQGQPPQPYAGQMIVGFGVIFLLAADVVAAGLGVAALCQRGRKRLFGILGLVFSGGVLFLTIGLMVIGLIFASRFTR